ncbi:hypothetical protein [Pseudoalteromonas rubra]|uniref:hypothetical protein n=1 Tax=Pseudoalteromonas rubra TaxID=43658 RepID=UPI000695E704|nr:hypothetical protein [Pseudoalteromonas rubra]
MKLTQLLWVALLMLSLRTFALEQVIIKRYLSDEDSPIKHIPHLSYFHLDDFESGSVSVPGVTIDQGYIRAPAKYVDSVDGDDGVINSRCGGCRGYFVSQKNQLGVNITFDREALGALPTDAGLVWTDGKGLTKFIAYDEAGNVIAQSDPQDISDSSFHGTTGDDHYFGTFYEQGIARIYIESTIDALEFDHLQFGHRLQERQEPIGPLNYTSFEKDSPFYSEQSAFDYFHLLDFESSTDLEKGAIFSDGYVRTPSNFVDSVDADDGVLDGQCVSCHSFYVNQSNKQGVTITFDAVSLGHLPTHVGVVWVDGAGLTRFIAYDNEGAVIADSGLINIADDSFYGTTADDTFFGVISESGVSSIYIENSEDDLEIDHVQFGYQNLQPALPIGPTPYLSFEQDSPFYALKDVFGYFHLQTFEHGMGDAVGASFSRGVVRAPASFVDSVDGDDGVVDGKCASCKSFYVDQSAELGLMITFNKAELGTLPTHAGIVWTDGKGETRFKAYDEFGNVIADSGQVSIADDSFYGTVSDDHFFGVTAHKGIARLYIENTIDGLEIDHLQYGYLGAPQTIKPLSYRDFERDSPFYSYAQSALYSHLETFESGHLSVPGVSASRGLVRNTARYVDSVDADDGKIDGYCTGCRSYYVNQSTQAGVSFTFDKNTLGKLPNYAGLVWVDGKGLTRFIAYDEQGNMIGDSGYVSIADDSFYSTVEDDHFFGIESSQGIYRIFIENTENDLELDHLQFGHK